jgi:hypothetical protein
MAALTTEAMTVFSAFSQTVPMRHFSILEQTSRRAGKVSCCQLLEPRNSNKTYLSVCKGKGKAGEGQAEQWGPAVSVNTGGGGHRGRKEHDSADAPLLQQKTLCPALSNSLVVSLGQAYSIHFLLTLIIGYFHHLDLDSSSAGTEPSPLILCVTALPVLWSKGRPSSPLPY